MMMMDDEHGMGIAVLPVAGLPEVRPNDDLAAMLWAAVGSIARPGDVMIVTQKIVSKAEGRSVEIAGVVPSLEAVELASAVNKDPRLVHLVLAESAAVIRAAPNVLITRHRSGHVMANAGIDQSNVGEGTGGQVLLLPLDADASAARIADALARLSGFELPVVISDSFGRPWRVGVVNVAIGAAGLVAMVDHRGLPDRDGRALEVTQVAVADMLATAAGLVMGEGAEGVPAALIRGARWQPGGGGAKAVVRPADQDLFR